MPVAINPSLRVEHQLLLACTGSAPGGEAIAELAAGSIDWKFVCAEAHRHGVAPIVFRQLSQAHRAGAHVDHEALDSLHDTAANVATQNLKLTGDLIAVSDALEAVGIGVIAYKGPVLAARAYGDTALRHFSDLDVLVRTGDLSRAGDVITGLGYRDTILRGGTEERALHKWGHHEAYVGPQATLLELHWRFSNPMFGFDLPTSDVWTACEWVRFGTARVRALAPLHELLVVLSHGAAHGWRQLSWLLDAHKLVESHRGLDYAHLLRVADRTGCRRVVVSGFGLCNSLFGTAVPDPVAVAIDGEPWTRQVTDAVMRLMFAEKPSSLTYARLQFLLRDRGMDRVRFVAQAVFRPTPADALALPLPPVLYPLFYAVRPLRLALKLRPR